MTVGTPWLVAIAALLATSCSAAGTTDLSTVRRAAEEAAARGDCPREVELLGTVIAQSPDPSSLRSRGDCLLKLGRVSQAIDDLQSAMRLDPSYNSAVDLAAAEWQAGFIAAARRTLQSAAALAQGPHDVLAVASTAVSYGDDAAADGMLGQVPSGDRDFNWYVLRAQLDSRLANPSSYEGDFARAIQLAPRDSLGHVLTLLGDIRWQVGAYGQAIDAYAKALMVGVDTDPLHVHRQMADCYAKLQNFPQAAMEYRLALTYARLPLDRASLEVAYARILIELNRLPEAKVALDEVLAGGLSTSFSLRQEAQQLRMALLPASGGG